MKTFLPVALSAVFVLTAPAMTRSADAPASTVVLNLDTTPWRFCVSRRAAVLVAPAGSAERTTLAGKRIPATQADDVQPSAPADWSAVAFDDSRWPSVPGSDMENLLYLADSGGMQGGTIAALLECGTIRLRGRFAVPDPASAGKLTLRLAYRGGVAVYLNGVEVARANLPDAPTGQRAADFTPGAPYAADAWIDAAGKLLSTRARDDDAKRRLASRDRTLGPIVLPADRLVKGVNVLAVQVFRSDYDPVARQFVQGKGELAWSPAALRELTLSADGGVTPNVARPPGVQVFNQDRNDRLRKEDWGDPNAALSPIELTGARNGVFWGKVVVGADRQPPGLAAAASALTRTGGGTIPASAVAVRYSPPALGAGGPAWNEPMSEQPPADAAVVSVWIGVSVPADAAAGDYAGRLEVSAESGRLADVPVRLHVADWSLPRPQDDDIFVSLYESPTALAKTYDVPMWSKRHWELLERSMELMGGLGVDAVQIPVISRTRLGDDEGFVLWKKKADGTFDYDFSIVDQYLSLVKKHVGVPRFVVLHIWHGGGWRDAGAKQLSLAGEPVNKVTVVDADGKRSTMVVPEFGTDESRKFWTPVLHGLRDVLAKHGMEKSLTLGYLAEQYPPEAVNRELTAILGPDVQWNRNTHGAHGALGTPEPLPGGGHVGMHVYTYLAGLAPAEKAIPMMATSGWPHVAYYRRAQGVGFSLLGHRLLAEEALYRGLPGFARVGMDYWPIRDSRGRTTSLYGRWGHPASSYPGDPEPLWLVWPGPRGPEPIAAYESVREGIQQSQAMLAIARALAARPNALSPELAARCRAALADELEFLKTRDGCRYQYLYFHMDHCGWLELSGRIYALATEVAAASRPGR
ncbi:MAG: hypothetical protein BIFFINMI_01987 [Phycisphaerae bacterium]|nr:hypothetical protein [Phycisphaerae bacterium]